MDLVAKAALTQQLQHLALIRRRRLKRKGKEEA
jgi:hypothetical protein